MEITELVETALLEKISNLLGKKRVTSEKELMVVAGHIIDPFLVDIFKLPKVVRSVIAHTVKPNDVERFELMLQTVKSDAENIRRDHPFPEELALNARLLLEIYLFDKKIATDETIEAFIPTAEKLLAENKLKWIKGLERNLAVEELVSLIKLALVQTNLCRPEAFGELKSITFEDVNVGSLNFIDLSNKISEYLDIDGALRQIPDIYDTLSDYAEELLIELS